MADSSIVFDYDYTYEPPNDSLPLNLTPYVPDPQTILCQTRAMHTSAAIALPILHIAIFLLAVPGNLLVGLVIASSRQRLTPSDVYLFHLTVADGLLALTLPFWAAEVTHGWVFGDFLCKLVNLVLEANFYTSILFLVCISVDRYLVIVRAAESRAERHRRCSWVACAAVWALGCFLALPALFNDAFVPPNSRVTVCQEQYDVGSATSWRLATRALRHVLGFLVPLVVMVTCYGVTVARLLRTRGFRKHRAMRVIVAVVIAFLLCWTPNHLAVMADTLIRAKLVPYDCPVRRSVDLAILVTHCLALTHSCINPVLYAFVGEKFRRNLAIMVQRRRRQERTASSTARFSRSTSQTSEGNGQLM